MTTISTNPCQNGRRNRTVGRQDIQGTDHVTTLAKCQEDLLKKTDQTRTMVAFMYFVLYEQITGLKASQTECSRDFKCQGTHFKRLVTGKKQPGGPGRSGKQRSKRTLGKVAELEVDTLAKQQRKSTRTPKPRTGKGKRSK